MKISLGVYESLPFRQLKGELAARDGPEGVLTPENISGMFYLKTTALHGRLSGWSSAHAIWHRSPSATEETHMDWSLINTTLKSLEKPFHIYCKPHLSPS